VLHPMMYDLLFLESEQLQNSMWNPQSCYC
jgi:hypothetical protein